MGQIWNIWNSIKYNLFERSVLPQFTKINYFQYDIELVILNETDNSEYFPDLLNSNFRPYFSIQVKKNEIFLFEIFLMVQ